MALEYEETDEMGTWLVTELPNAKKRVLMADKASQKFRDMQAKVTAEMTHNEEVKIMTALEMDELKLKLKQAGIEGF